MDLFSMDPNWIVAYRTETLTAFFISFSHYVNYYIYLYAIALGYWLAPRNKAFINLGFLFPFTILLNSIIKALMQIPRPDASLHLVKAFGPFGFPSGDAQLSAVFWLCLFMAFRGTMWKWIFTIPIALSAFSRVYLGVHSIYDVSGGVLLGVLVIYLFYRPFVQSYVENWLKGQTLTFWLFSFATVGLYGLANREQFLDPFIFSFVGMLFGYGLALTLIQEHNNRNPLNYTIESYMNLAVAIIVLYSFIMYVYVANLTTLPAFNYSAILLKYAFVTFAVFGIVPKFMKQKAS